MSIARSKPSLRLPVRSPMPAAAGNVATASKPATRATALLVPDATPASESGTEASTVDVSGATVMDKPRPNTRTGGRTVAA